MVQSSDDIKFGDLSHTNYYQKSDVRIIGESQDILLLNFPQQDFKNAFFLVDTSRFFDDCGTVEMLVELWRVISKPKIERPESFGSMEYFHRDQHCENPNPDLLTRHGMTRKVGASGGLQGESVVTVVFHHVVEREFMLRLCPCVMSHCTCETIAPGSQVLCCIVCLLFVQFLFLQVCSKIIEVDNPAEDQVFSWCRGLAKSPAPKIDAPTVQHCPAQLRITGVLPSCTTVQDYDQVEVILQAYHGEPTNCNQRKLQELITSTALDKIVKLNSINKTHGSFDVDIENITQNVYYCVRVELGKHHFYNQCTMPSNIIIDWF